MFLGVMGIKSDTKSVSKSATPTAEQLRISQLTALPEGSSDEWPNNIQKLIKRVSNALDGVLKMFTRISG